VSRALLDTEDPPGFSLAGAQAWTAPVIDDAAALHARRREEAEAEQRLRAEAERRHAEAEARGHAAGLAAAQKEIDARQAALDEQGRALEAALAALARPLAQADDAIHEQIALLAVSVARGLVRRELRIDPTQVIGIVRDTVALLPAATRGVRVAMHPEDAALVRGRLTVSGPEPAWTVVDDAALARGDCRVYTDYAQIDARLETRLKEALVGLLGEERSAPRSGEDR
jgi:flagellar assembly protein FliH